MAKNTNLAIIAGPSSIDKENLEEIYDIARLTAENSEGNKQKAITGTIVVGLKSRTMLSDSSEDMGIDYDVMKKNLNIIMSGGRLQEMQTPPSIKFAKQIASETNLMVATEITMPMLQLPLYGREMPEGKFMPWNPAVDQLGWHLHLMGEYARRHNWSIGIKNGKWIGDKLKNVNKTDFEGESSIDKTWTGLSSYAGEVPGEKILIHRGVDVETTTNHTNEPVHEIAKRVKSATGAKLYFDPSHIYGPKMKDAIIPETVKAMKMQLEDEAYLYDGILIEAGTSKTDTDQHLSLLELGDLVKELASFRDLLPPKF